MNKIKHLNGEMLARACAFAAKPKDPRFYLRSVFVERREEGGVYIVSTNGHVLCCYTDPFAIPHLDFESVMIDIYQENSSRIKPVFTQLKKTSEARIDVEDQNGQGGISIRYNDDTTFVKTIEGTFPDWQRIFKQEVEHQESVSFDPKYLGLLKDFVLKGSNDSVTLLRSSAEKVNIFQTPNGVVGVMPRKTQDLDDNELLNSEVAVLEEVSNG
jgi:hypothetical protein